MIHSLQRGGGNIQKALYGALYRLRHLFLICVVLILVSGCQAARSISITQKEDGKAVFKRIAVVPFQRISTEDSDVKTVRCPLCGQLITAEKIPQGSEKIVEDIFIEKLTNQNIFTLIPPERVGGIYERVSAGYLKAAPIEILKKVGNELEADGIVVCHVYRFKERKGYSYSVEKSASVGFEIHLIRVSDGAVVWKGIFDKTQTSLMENILQIVYFYKERGRWLTAQELATEGIDEILKEFPGLKKE
ncbi:MAG: hypothetical protein ABFD82_22825 [Syntrophaceae bacterium]